MGFGVSKRHIFVLLAIATVAGALGDTGMMARADGTPLADTSAIEGEIAAPELFDAADTGVWDGRPTTGGIWVAHANADHPLRVMIQNEADGRWVAGTLFRRERDLPGPKFQLSAEAAAALDLPADTPTQLRVTALRHAEAPAAEPAPAPPAVSQLARPYIQIGLFSVERNATRAAAHLGGKGLETVIRKSDISGKVYWRVLVGPAQTLAARAENLTKVKALGYSDSYAVKG